MLETKPLQSAGVVEKDLRSVAYANAAVSSAVTPGDGPPLRLKWAEDKRFPESEVPPVLAVGIECYFALPLTGQISLWENFWEIIEDVGKGLATRMFILMSAM